MPKLMSRLGRWLAAGGKRAAVRTGARTVAPVHPISDATLSASCLIKRVHAVVEMTGHGPVMSALPQETRPLYDVLWGGLREFALPDPGAPATEAPVRERVSPEPREPLPALRKVVIVILTWNGLELTRRCLDTLRRNTTHPDYEVWVVDNASSDGTVEYLRTLSWVHLIENDRNLGFVRGNNQAIAACDGAADIVLLNNDIEVHQSDWLERLQHTAWSAADVGVVGCRLRRPDGRLQHAGSYMPLDSLWGQQVAAHEEDIGQYTRDREVEGVVFACAYLKREMIGSVGPLDERYFAYFEDSDYCLSARAAGFRTVCCGSVTLDHHENSSTRVNGVAHRPLFLRSQAAFREKWERRLRDTRYTRRLGWHSTINLPTGYSISSRELVLALDRAGVEVGYRFLYGPGSTQPATEPEQTGLDLLNHVRDRPLDPNGVHVAYGQADAFHRAGGGYRIGYTMLETDGVPRAWVEQANRMDEIWVPSTFNVGTMRESGVVRPIHCVPLGIDPNYFHPRIAGSRHGGVFTFLSVFEWGERKAPEVLLRAFTDEFRAREDVVLLLKVVNRDGDVDVREQIAHLGLARDGGRVLLSLNDVIPTYQLGSLYRSADCLVLASRGEGWGMPALEAMACGLPVIATRWSAMTDFIDESVAYPLDVERMVPAVAKCPYYKGFSWAEPSYEHLRHQMRHVFEHPDEARGRGTRASEVAHARWTWDQAAQRIVQRLTEIGS
ncbi:glycosyl transferase : Glycosyl transferase family 2 OS=Paenibacillus alvei DSM 29 GN=PAV_5c01900 PE=4 SV=1: Glycos_transf_2: Glycos_transf_1 [Gemmataceae bacterium]|nr:glycosyl transferase : Glycosyl transferase family 2 OS=Paenibacillus alvei DSM 29 GN=PAV_5c01900 PE=4 SV=1: Glycos_transf_2: Glycos_transf_1 [Gemmataceae bacterium]VTU02611.1 glycosyl transferase : Glycosyl transferase family 2 OS=Paenibacillus alvei DSM 29 GN=PAV_5c01900 PE=4 SV=1: Glycos_transf_2: Glycos_transf_1 [Gemmataceae bacterium]